MIISTFTNPTIYDVRQDLVPLPKLPHILYSHLISSLDNLMMAYIQGRNMYLYITFCQLIVILLCSWLYVYIDIYTLQLCIIEKPAVDLQIGLHCEKATISCLWSIIDTYIFHLKIDWFELQSCFRCVQ